MPATKNDAFLTYLEVSLDDTGGSLTDVKNVIVGGLPILLSNAIKVGNGIAQRFCEFALTSGAHEGILNGLVVPEQVNLKEGGRTEGESKEGGKAKNKVSVSKIVRLQGYQASFVRAKSDE